MITLIHDTKNSPKGFLKFIDYRTVIDKLSEYPYSKMNCIICKMKTNCLGVCYPYLIKIYDKADVPISLFPVCQACLTTTGTRELFLNIKDYFISNEIAKWFRGERSIVKNQNEFDRMSRFANEKGVLKRELVRDRFPTSLKDREKKYMMQSLFKNKTNNIQANLLYQAMLKKR